MINEDTSVQGTETMTLAKSNVQGLPDGPFQYTDINVRNEIVDVLRESANGLTDVSLEAVIALRHELVVWKVLHDLLLDGRIEAALEDPNARGSARFAFYVPTESERAAMNRLVVAEAD